jgi:hypothetical protein
MVYVSEHAMLSERRMNFRARKKKKKEGAWRGPRTLFCLFAAATASVLLLFLLASLGRVESSSTELVHAYGGTGSDYGECVIEHSFDQGFALVGRTTSFGAGSNDIVLTKTNNVGIELWTKTYGGTGTDYASFVMEHSPDQGFALAGHTTSFGAGGDDIIFVKTNIMGVVLWTKTYGGAGTDRASCVIEHSSDDGFILAGHTTSVGAGAEDMVLVKTNSVGVKMWTKTYGGSGHDYANSMIEYSIDQGLVFAGHKANFGNHGDYDFIVVKTNSVGLVLWTKTYGGAGAGNVDIAYCVIEHSIDNGLAITGRTASYGAGADDIMLVKTNSVGVEVWTKTYGGTWNEIAFSMIEHSLDHGFLIAGATRS